MLKKVIEYKNYDDEPRSKTLYFNLTKTEILDMGGLEKRLSEWSKKVEGPERQLTEAEVRELLSIVLLLVETSYGVRSEDGERFVKTEEYFDEFKQTAAYDAFIMSLFENPQNCVDFMVGIVPKDLAAQAQVEMGKTAPSIVDAQLPNDPEQFDAQVWPNGPRQFHNYSDDELLAMSDSEFFDLVGHENPSEMSPRQLRLAFARKNRSQS